MYELISVENGDVLFGHDDRELAVGNLLEYVDTHRTFYPGLEEQVALIELDEHGRQVGETLFYAQLVRSGEAVT